MKRFFTYLMGAVVLLAGTSCEPYGKDEYIFNSHKAYEPAVVPLVHTLQCVAHSAGALVAAQNLTEYIEAPEEEKQAVEDKYYTYLKVREMEDGLWRIYSDDWDEQYRITNGKTLSESGAKWVVLKNRNFFGEAVEPTQKVDISCTEQDKFAVTLTDVATSVNFRNYSFPLLARLEQPASQLSGRVLFNGEIAISSNYSTFRTSAEVPLEFAIEGSGDFFDLSGAFYHIKFDITEPFGFVFGSSGFPQTIPSSGAITIEVYTSPETVETIVAKVQEDQNIHITYTVDGKQFQGTYQAS